MKIYGRKYSQVREPVNLNIWNKKADILLCRMFSICGTPNEKIFQR